MKSCIIALDIGGTFLKSCLFTENGELIEGSFDREPVDSDGLSRMEHKYTALYGVPLRPWF